MKLNSATVEENCFWDGEKAKALFNHMREDLNASVSKFFNLCSICLFVFCVNPYFILVISIEIFVFYNWLYLPTLNANKLTLALQNKELKDLNDKLGQNHGSSHKESNYQLLC